MIEYCVMFYTVQWTIGFIWTSHWECVFLIKPKEYVCSVVLDNNVAGRQKVFWSALILDPNLQSVHCTHPDFTSLNQMKVLNENQWWEWVALISTSALYPLKVQTAHWPGGLESTGTEIHNDTNHKLTQRDTKWWSVVKCLNCRWFEVVSPNKKMNQEAEIYVN